MEKSVAYSSNNVSDDAQIRKNLKRKAPVQTNPNSGQKPKKRLRACAPASSAHCPQNLHAPNSTINTSSNNYDTFGFHLVSLHIKILNGSTTMLSASLYDSILSIKEEIFRTEGIPIEYQRLVYRGRLMGDDKRVGDYFVPSAFEPCVVNMVFQLEGGFGLNL
eukprot:TRINITY_DN13748_c0_g1_i1.p1 TRINITY_DN13748_c0_g1~~TRINITY_DN13748_c0_g1_i1.p1  ORF type:complete len:163 (-),score=23.58 TRINITY_DN13748_c0_g1_i1:62-550(-)